PYGSIRISGSAARGTGCSSSSPCWPGSAARSSTPSSGSATGRCSRWLRADLELLELFAAFHHDALLLIGAEHEMCAGAGDAFEGGEFFGDKLRHLPQRSALDKNQQIVAAGHQEQ